MHDLARCAVTILSVLLFRAQFDLYGQCLYHINPAMKSFIFPVIQPYPETLQCQSFDNILWTRNERMGREYFSPQRKSHYIQYPVMILSDEYLTQSVLSEKRFWFIGSKNWSVSGPKERPWKKDHRYAKRPCSQPEILNFNPILYIPITLQ